MIFEPRLINGKRINFYIGTTACGGNRRGQLQHALIRSRIDEMVNTLSRLPDPHLGLLTGVPVIIWNGPDDVSGGWYRPGQEDSVWLDPVTTEQRFGVNGNDISTLPHSRGIISICTSVLATRPGREQQRTEQDCLRTVTHEIGHCVDHHLGLASNPPSNGYRSGNQAYQGQLYRNRGYVEHEFRAETYSRLFTVRNPAIFMCRRADARPPCLPGGTSHRQCSIRLQTDLSYSPAFRGLRSYLPQAAIINADDSSSSSRGPVGRRPATTLSDSQLNPHAHGRTPGSQSLV